jgi:hypothetical protein
MSDPDRTIARRTLIIMLGVMAIYTWPISASLIGARPGWAGRLLGFHPHAAWGWGLGVAITVAYVAVSMKRLPMIRQHAFDITALKLVAVPFSLAAGFVEELVFRRELMNAAAHADWAWPLQIIASACAFGALHAVWGVFGGSWRAMVWPMLFTSALGAAYGIVYLIDGRDVAPCVWSHSAIDLCIEPWLLMAVLQRHRPSPVSALAGVALNAPIERP